MKYLTIKTAIVICLISAGIGFFNESLKVVGYAAIVITHSLFLHKQNTLEK